VFVGVTVLVVGVIRMFFVAVIFVVFIGGDLFTSGFFGEKLAMKSVSIGDISLVCSCFQVVFFVGVSRQQVVLCSEFEVMRGFAVCVGCGDQKFVVVFGVIVVFVGHNQMGRLFFEKR
jgi:hypothetical protein